jgi:putative PIN family toxin of toxin-antitoxin system
MRVVLDTNVLVSGLLSESGPPGWIVDLLLAGEITCGYDGRILAEYREVLQRRELKLPKETVASLVTFIESFGLCITARPWAHALPDPDDEPFLAIAAALDAVLISGNLKHFPEKARGNVRVLTPREFLTRWREEPGGNAS